MSIPQRELLRAMRIFNSLHIGLRDQLTQNAGKDVYRLVEQGKIPQNPYSENVTCQSRDGTEEKEGTVFYPNSHTVLTDRGRIVVIFKTEAGKEE